MSGERGREKGGLRLFFGVHNNLRFLQLGFKRFDLFFLQTLLAAQLPLAHPDHERADDKAYRGESEHQHI